MFGVPNSTGHHILTESSARRRHNKPDKPETRGRKSIVTPEQLREMEQILETEGLEGRGLTWQQLYLLHSAIKGNLS